ncbi:hypothetical protein B0O99DRAFT_247290 [Bisporella sp. PMI_857]|nr:hypothetical protein B0O99DRAFT_247290 [Bisporella sp. PMI_857]
MAEVHGNTQNLTWEIAPTRICKLKKGSYYNSLDVAWLSLVLCLGGIGRFNSTETNPFFLKILRGEPSRFCLPNLWPHFTSSLLYRRIFDRVTGSVPVLKPFINLCRGRYYVVPKSTSFYKKRITALLKLNQDFAFYGIPLKGLRYHLTFAGDNTLLWLPSMIFCLLCLLLIGLGKVGILFTLIGGTIFWLLLALTAYSSKMYVQSLSCLNAAYEQSSTEYLTTRGVLVFAEKGLLALAGEHVRKGDHICWLLGCTRPLIVRKVISGDGTRYHVVGEALVYPSDKDRRVNFVGFDSTFSAEARTAWIEEKLASNFFQDIILV